MERSRSRPRSRSPREHRSHHYQSLSKERKSEMLRHRRDSCRGRSRSRSRSPQDRSRIRYHKSRDCENYRYHERHRSRSMSPHKSRDSKHHSGVGHSAEDIQQDDNAKLMKEIMGFSAFDSTKGKKVPTNNNVGAVKIQRPKRYRQYMNRRGGFNRKLDPIK